MSKSPTTLEPTVSPKSGEGDGTRGPRIRCPMCGWQPRAHDRWACMCGRVWNTFDTGGVCPGCMYQWKVTACPACGRFSPHSDWYEHKE
jgi:hypothetical protein